MVTITFLKSLSFGDDFRYQSLNPRNLRSVASRYDFFRRQCMYLHQIGLSPTNRSQKQLIAYLIPGLLLSAVLAMFTSPGNAQQLTGTLSGTVYDQTAAVVVNAKVELKNEASGDLRRGVSDKVGFFSITAVQPGTYTITISAEGFATWQEPGIAMGQGDTRSVAN